MVAARFKVQPDEAAERLMLSLAGDVIGLRGLVAAFLTYEAGFAKKRASIRQMFMEVIDEELEKKGIPRDVIFGSH